MSRRLAWVLWALAMAVNVAFVVLLVADWGSPGPLELDDDAFIIVVYLLLFVTFPTVGALIASRQPRNPIGWLCVLAGIAMAAGFTAMLYADYALYQRPGALPAPALAAKLSQWLTPIGLFITPVFLLLLFPHGRLPSPRWRWPVRVLVAVVGVGLAADLLAPGLQGPFAGVENPLAVTGAAATVIRLLADVSLAWVAPTFVLGASAMIVRFRRAGGEERQQLKWFAYAASLMGAAFALSFILSALELAVLADAAFVAGAFSLAGLPVAVGVAVLRYRLYEIDLIISRTVSYTLLSGVLGSAYLAGVVVLGQLLRPFGAESELAVAGSTLLVAALFGRLRRIVQHAVDRRFNRSRYDAGLAVASFRDGLRDAVQLDELSSELVATVHATVQPISASVWLAPSRRTS